MNVTMDISIDTAIAIVVSLLLLLLPVLFVVLHTKSKTCPRKMTLYENVLQQAGASPTFSSTSKQQDLTKKKGPGLTVRVLNLWLAFGWLVGGHVHNESSFWVKSCCSGLTLTIIVAVIMISIAIAVLTTIMVILTLH